MEETERKSGLEGAREAGEEALRSLYAVREKLNSAKKWGVFDVLGRRSITTLVKQSRINEVEVLIEQARIKLTDFQIVLRKMAFPPDLRKEVSSFLTFADFAFENPITDFPVQSSLQSVREEVEDTIQLIEELLLHIREQ